MLPTNYDVKEPKKTVQDNAEVANQDIMTSDNTMLLPVIVYVFGLFTSFSGRMRILYSLFIFNISIKHIKSVGYMKPSDASS